MKKTAHGYNMTTKSFTVTSRDQWLSLLRFWRAFICEKPFYVKITDQRVRTLEQNALLHALLRDIVNDGTTFAGQEWGVEDWKAIFASGYRQAVKGEQPRIIVGLENEVINMGKGTHTMGVGELSELIEYIEAWRAGNADT